MYPYKGMERKNLWRLVEMAWDSNAVEFVHSSSSKRNYSRDDKSMDMYDVYDYDDPEDFYYDHVDEFDDIQDAEDYWEENR